ncbi:c-type cytochrome [Mucilaginibacter segetis]|uniref:Photosynthetic reaction center cytochrome c subunit n=1 Tax=Mucilaginibacter segetis TaxID=2793071 RepID=A0A934ULU9_9SPHI|nr:c-type cytochrome [Mucilaginibacter segetis]MBK0378968.1 c-type cytochrome [Mucilaginibacter segetis]
MNINKKLLATLSLLSIVIFMAMSPPQAEEKFKNLKVLPKNISHDDLHRVMDEWEHSLGVHCSFCHARNEETKKMDFASDAKPEKEMARHMYKMMTMLNKKYFKAQKDSIGMYTETGVNCYTCHRGDAHPEVVSPPEEKRGPRGNAPEGNRPPPPPPVAPAN